MAWRLYLVPVIGDGSSLADGRRPKYIADGGAAAGYAAMDYGDEPVMLVAANTTTPEHNAIVANSDATTVPANLANTIGAALATVQAKLEAFNIPSGWVTSGMTYATLVAWIVRLFIVNQRFQGLLGGRFFPPGITLDSTFGDLTLNQRQKLATAATSLGIDTSGVTLATTIRAALKSVADQCPVLTNSLGGVSW